MVNIWMIIAIVLYAIGALSPIIMAKMHDAYHIIAAIIIGIFWPITTIVLIAILVRTKTYLTANDIKVISNEES